MISGLYFSVYSLLVTFSTFPHAQSHYSQRSVYEKRYVFPQPYFMSQLNIKNSWGLIKHRVVSWSSINACTNLAKKNNNNSFAIKYAHAHHCITHNNEQPIRKQQAVAISTWGSSQSESAILGGLFEHREFQGRDWSGLTSILLPNVFKNSSLSGKNTQIILLHVHR